MAMTCSACATPATTSCTMCRTPLCDEHQLLGHPLITARQLVATTASTAVRAPGMLGDILFKELDQVPYCAECREQVAAKRTGEQLKFLLTLLLVLALVLGVPLYLLLFA
jgi:hypothetical protein